MIRGIQIEGLPSGHTKLNPCRCVCIVRPRWDTGSDRGDLISADGSSSKGQDLCVPLRGCTLLKRPRALYESTRGPESYSLSLWKNYGLAPTLFGINAPSPEDNENRKLIIEIGFYIQK